MTSRASAAVRGTSLYDTRRPCDGACEPAPFAAAHTCPPRLASFRRSAERQNVTRLGSRSVRAWQTGWRHSVILQNDRMSPASVRGPSAYSRPFGVIPSFCRTTECHAPRFAVRPRTANRLASFRHSAERQNVTRLGPHSLRAWQTVWRHSVILQNDRMSHASVRGPSAYGRPAGVIPSFCRMTECHSPRPAYCPHTTPLARVMSWHNETGWRHSVVLQNDRMSSARAKLGVAYDWPGWRHSSVLRKVKTFSPRFVSLCRTHRPACLFITKPAMASFRMCSATVFIPMLNRSDISSTESSGSLDSRAKIAIRR